MVTDGDLPEITANLLDAPLAAPYSLRIALQRPILPIWAWDTLREVQEGRLKRALREALKVV